MRHTLRKLFVPAFFALFAFNSSHALTPIEFLPVDTVGELRDCTATIRSRGEGEYVLRGSCTFTSRIPFGTDPDDLLSPPKAWALVFEDVPQELRGVNEPNWEKVAGPLLAVIASEEPFELIKKTGNTMEFAASGIGGSLIVTNGKGADVDLTATVKSNSMDIITEIMGIDQPDWLKELRSTWEIRFKASDELLAIVAASSIALYFVRDDGTVEAASEPVIAVRGRGR